MHESPLQSGLSRFLMKSIPGSGGESWVRCFYCSHEERGGGSVASPPYWW